MAKKPSIRLGRIYYLPFWTILNYLDPNPPDPFVKVRLHRLSSSPVMAATKDGFDKSTIQTCSVELTPDVIIDCIPVSYLIHKSELTEWGDRFAQWFTTFAKDNS